MKRDAIGQVVLVILCQAVHGLTFLAIALFLPLIREDLQISFSQAGLLAAAATLSYAAGQIPAGYFSDRFGPQRLFFIGLMGWAVMSLTFGLIESFWLAVVNQVVAGAFRSLLFAPGLSLLVAAFGPERRATAMSLFMLGGLAGNIVLALLGPWLAVHAGWRWTYMLFAALGIASALLYRAYATKPVARQGGARVGVRDMLHLLRYRILWVCNALQFIRFATMTAFSFWLPTLLVSERGFSLAAAGLVMAMSAAITACGNPVGGYVSDRTRNPPLVIGCSLAVLACTATLLVLVDSIPMLLLVIAVNSLFLGFYFGPLFLVSIEILGARAAGTAIGVTNFFANLGALFTAYGLGVVKDALGTFSWGFASISVLCLLGVGLSVALSRMRGHALAAKLRAEGAS